MGQRSRRTLTGPPVSSPRRHKRQVRASQGAVMASSTSGYQGFVEPEPTPAQVIAGLRATVGDNPVQLLTPEGERIADGRWDRWISDVDSGTDSGDAEALCGLYRDMVLVRRADREANALQRQGQLGIWVPLLGQEAAQIGSGRALKPGDMAFPSYREHGVAYARGVDFRELLGIFRCTDHSGWDYKAHGFH